MAMNDNLVGEYLELPFRQIGGFALAPEEENGENPTERHVVHGPTASRQGHGSVGLLVPLRGHLHCEWGNALGRHSHIKPWLLSEDATLVAQRHMVKEHP